MRGKRQKCSMATVMSSLEQEHVQTNLGTFQGKLNSYDDYICVHYQHSICKESFPIFFNTRGITRANGSSATAPFPCCRADHIQHKPILHDMGGLFCAGETCMQYASPLYPQGVSTRPDLQDLKARNLMVFNSFK